MRSYQYQTKINMQKFVEFFAKRYEEKLNQGSSVTKSVEVAKIIVSSTTNCSFDLKVTPEHCDPLAGIESYSVIFFDYYIQINGGCMLSSREIDEIYNDFMIGLYPTFAEDKLEYLREQKKSRLESEKQKYEQRVGNINAEYDKLMDSIKSKQEELYPHVNP